MEDPNIHLVTFYEACDIIRLNGVTKYAIRLRLFPVSLKDKAKSWFHLLQLGSITTRNEMTQKFLAKYFSPFKALHLRTKIAIFRQQDGEPLWEALGAIQGIVKKMSLTWLPTMTLNSPIFLKALSIKKEP